MIAFGKWFIFKLKGTILIFELFFISIGVTTISRNESSSEMCKLLIISHVITCTKVVNSTCLYFEGF
jgi:hypothetical protein